jgi:DNA-binding transcriptional regulator YiaG
MGADTPEDKDADTPQGGEAPPERAKRHRKPRGIDNPPRSEFDVWRKGVMLSEEDAAEALGVSRRTVQDYGSGKVVPGKSVLVHMAVIASGLDVPPWSPPQTDEL